MTNILIKTRRGRLSVNLPHFVRFEVRVNRVPSPREKKKVYLLRNVLDKNVKETCLFFKCTQPDCVGELRVLREQAPIPGDFNGLHGSKLWHVFTTAWLTSGTR